MEVYLGPENQKRVKKIKRQKIKSSAHLPIVGENYN